MVGTNSYVAKLKAQLDKAIIQREHWKQLAENRNSILVTEVCPESRSVEEHIIDADSVRESWRLMRGYREQIEALRAENGHWKGMHASSMALRMSAEFERDELRTELDEARGLLESAVVLFACHCTDATAKNWHDAAAAFLTATPAPEVQASGPYASVAGALAQRYPKPSLLKDCNVSYSNSSRPLAEQGERHENNQYVRALVSADDVRDACANAASVFAEEANADQCREAVEYMREVLLAQIAHRQAQSQASE